jgi:hypothetical protein
MRAGRCRQPPLARGGGSAWPRHAGPARERRPGNYETSAVEERRAALRALHCPEKPPPSRGQLGRHPCVLARSHSRSLRLSSRSASGDRQYARRDGFPAPRTH